MPAATFARPAGELSRGGGGASLSADAEADGAVGVFAGAGDADTADVAAGETPASVVESLLQAVRTTHATREGGTHENRIRRWYARASERLPQHGDHGDHGHKRDHDAHDNPDWWA